MTKTVTGLWTGLWESFLSQLHSSYAVNPLSNCPHWETCPETKNGSCRAQHKCIRKAVDDKLHLETEKLNARFQAAVLEAQSRGGHMKDIRVKSGANCPANENGEHFTCRLDRENRECDPFKPAPEWCLLREGPVTLVLESTDEGDTET